MDANEDSVSKASDAGGYFLHRRKGVKMALFGAAGAVAAAMAASARAGYGACASCKCPAYSGNQAVCQNCGHNYAAHW